MNKYSQKRKIVCALTQPFIKSSIFLGSTHVSHLRTYSRVNIQVLELYMCYFLDNNEAK